MSKCLLAPSVNSEVTQLQNIRKTKFSANWLCSIEQKPNELVAIWQNNVSQTYCSRNDIVCFSSMKFEVQRGREKLQSLQNCSNLREIINSPEDVGYKFTEFCEFCEICDAHSGIGKGPRRSKKQERQSKLGFGAIWWGEGDDVPNVVPKAPLTSWWDSLDFFLYIVVELEYKISNGNT